MLMAPARGATGSPTFLTDQGKLTAASLSLWKVTLKASARHSFHYMASRQQEVLGTQGACANCAVINTAFALQTEVICSGLPAASSTAGNTQMHCLHCRYQEKFYFNPGDTGFQVFDTKYAKIGVAVCWDQWFPEAARCMALKGAEVKSNHIWRVLHIVQLDGNTPGICEQLILSVVLYLKSISHYNLNS